MMNDNEAGLAAMSQQDQRAALAMMTAANALTDGGAPVPVVVAALMTTAIEIMRRKAGEAGMKLWLAQTTVGVLGGV